MRSSTTCGRRHDSGGSAMNGHLVHVDGFPNGVSSQPVRTLQHTLACPQVLEREVDCAIMAAAKMQREWLKSVEAKFEGVRDLRNVVKARAPLPWIFNADDAVELLLAGASSRHIQVVSCHCAHMTRPFKD